jgi:hypothetical protein
MRGIVQLRLSLRDLAVFGLPGLETPALGKNMCHVPLLGSKHT